MASNAEHIKWFRDSSPYIDAHRGKTFVLCLTGDVFQSTNLHNIVKDIALLNSLGIRLVVVFGADDRVAAVLVLEVGAECSASRHDGAQERPVVARGSRQAHGVGIGEHPDAIHRGEVPQPDPRSGRQVG